MGRNLGIKKCKKFHGQFIYAIIKSEQVCVCVAYLVYNAFQITLSMRFTHIRYTVLSRKNAFYSRYLFWAENDQ